MKTPRDVLDKGDQELLIDTEQVQLLDSRRERLNLGSALTNAQVKDLPWTGIGLSGGGIRAGAFALGVLQALAELNILRRFDYISTVSGGGYVGGALQWWWSEKRKKQETQPGKPSFEFGCDQTDFPYGTAVFRQSSPPQKDIPGAPPQPVTMKTRQKQNLDYLRNNASYLTPAGARAEWAMSAVLLRTILLSFLVWIPLFALMFMVPNVAELTFMKDALTGFLPEAAKTWVFDGTCTSLEHCFRFRQVYIGFLLLFAFGLALFIALTALFGFLSRSSVLKGWFDTMITIATGVAAVVLVYFLYGVEWRKVNFGVFDGWVAFLFVTALFLCLLRFSFGYFREQAATWAYWVRRFLEKCLGVIVAWSMVFLVIGLIPLVPYYSFIPKENASGGTEGILVGLATLFASISGAASALYGYYTTAKNVLPGVAGRIFAPLGAAFYIFSLLVFSYVASVLAIDIMSTAQLSLTGAKYQLTVLISFSLAILLSLMANLNHSGLHRFYRDRLMEAFMPHPAATSEGRPLKNYVADSISIAEIGPTTWHKGKRVLKSIPYPIINAHVSFSDETSSRIGIRGGDNFIMSPFFVGSAETGWAKTDAYFKQYGPISVPTAVAISGAAVNSNAGYVGTGITRNPLVAAVMALLNIRLGVWLGNPAKVGRWGYLRAPSFLMHVLVSLRARSKNRRLLELSDGGNFDNLGLYELIRRKAKLIVIVDGEEDEKIALPSLVSVLQRIEEDFQTTIKFLPGSAKGLGRLMPVPQAASYPSGLAISGSSFVVGEIQYGPNDTGSLIYIKSTMIDDVGLRVSGYRGQNPSFPHQSTADQFFDPAQFEAYRELGHCGATRMCQQTNLAAMFGKPADIYTQYSK